METPLEANEQIKARMEHVWTINCTRCSNVGMSYQDGEDDAAIQFEVQGWAILPWTWDPPGGDRQVLMRAFCPDCMKERPRYGPKP